jgi:hypothetical protein
MSTYTGPADLLDADGEVIAMDVQVRLVKSTTPGGIGTWNGSFGPIPLLPPTLGDTARVRLPDGTEGDVITNARMQGSEAGALILAVMHGSGPAPF